MHKRLPIANPIISSTGVDAIMSVLCTDEKYNNYAINHYIQLIFHGSARYTDVNIMLFADTYEAICPPIIKCPLFHSMLLTKELIKKHWRNLTDFIEEQVDDGFYCIQPLNTKHIKCSGNYGGFDFHHPMLIFGYDRDKKTIDIADYFNDKSFSHYKVGYDEVNAAYNDWLMPFGEEPATCSFDHTVFVHKFSRTICFKLFEQIEYIAIDYEGIAQELSDYLSSTASRIENYPFMHTFFYGISCYDKLIECVARDVLDYRMPFLYVDHKTLMKLRLEIFYENGHIAGSMYDKLMIMNQDMIDQSMQIRNLFLKSKVVGKTSDRIIPLLADLKEKDKLFSAALLECLP